MFSPSINGDADSFRPVTGPVWALPVQASASPRADGYEQLEQNLGPVESFAFMVGRALTSNMLRQREAIVFGYVVLAWAGWELLRHIRR